MPLHKLVDFAEPEIINEFLDYTWVIEVREVDDAGTPFNEEWEVFTTFLAGNGKKLAKYPEKHPILASYLKETREFYQAHQKSVELRIKLSRQVEREESVAATEPWVYIYKGEE